MIIIPNEWRKWRDFFIKAFQSIFPAKYECSADDKKRMKKYIRERLDRLKGRFNEGQPGPYDSKDIYVRSFHIPWIKRERYIRLPYFENGIVYEIIPLIEIRSDSSIGPNALQEIAQEHGADIPERRECPFCHNITCAVSIEEDPIKKGLFILTAKCEHCGREKSAHDLWIEAVEFIRPRRPAPGSGGSGGGSSGGPTTSGGGAPGGSGGGKVPGAMAARKPASGGQASQTAARADDVSTPRSA